MNGPTRLRDESDSPLERALLEAGASYRPSSDLRAKTLAALGVAGSATLLSAAVSASTISSAAKIAWSKLLIAASVVGVVGAAPIAYYAWQRATSDDAAGRRRAAPARALAQPEPAAPSPEPVPSIAAGAGQLPVPEISPDPAPAPQPSPVARAPRAGAGARPSLARELGALDAARTALASGDPAGALVLLDRYARNYPSGRLGLEAEVLRIDALARAGRTAAAREAAEAFLRRHPAGVFAARVRRRLDGLGARD